MNKGETVNETVEENTVKNTTPTQDFTKKRTTSEM
jgi:hypothetical protein